MVKSLNRRLIWILVLIFLTSALALQAATLAQADRRVFDEEGLFSQEEIVFLEDEISIARKELMMDVVILTGRAEYSSSDATAVKNGMAVADDFYDQNGFGVGEKLSGIIYFIDMENRLPIITTCGDMISYITDARLEEIFAHVAYFLSEGDFAGSAFSVLEDTKIFFEEGIPEGQHDYDGETGEIIPQVREKSLTPMEMTISGGVAAIAGLIQFFTVRSSYELRGSTYKYNPRENSNVTMNRIQDQYLRTTVTRTPKPQPKQNVSGGGRSGSGSATHTSSGGQTHGGGGGKRF